MQLMQAPTCLSLGCSRGPSRHGGLRQMHHLRLHHVVGPWRFWHRWRNLRHSFCQSRLSCAICTLVAASALQLCHLHHQKCQKYVPWLRHLCHSCAILAKEGWRNPPCLGPSLNECALMVIYFRNHLNIEIFFWQKFEDGIGGSVFSLLPEFKLQECKKLENFWKPIQ